MIIDVSGGGASLRNAVVSAQDGDEILVGDGVYDPIDTYSKNIVIRSQNGYKNCVIDGKKEQRCVTCFNGYDRSSRLYGFTLRNGYVASRSARGGGMLGGELHESLVVDCEVNGYNEAFGGGTMNTEVDRCVVMNCKSNMNSAAMHIDSRGYASNCLIVGCVGASGWGAICFYGNYISCTFVGNKSIGYRQLHVDEVSSCVFVGNTLMSGDKGVTYSSQKDYACKNNANDNGATNAGWFIDYVPSMKDFIDPSTLDFRLVKSSGLIDRGYKPRGELDLLGRPRVYGLNMDIGCIEWNPGDSVGKHKNVPTRITPLGI